LIIVAIATFDIDIAITALETTLNEIKPRGGISREDRKLQQYIQSIERMEQRKRGPRAAAGSTAANAGATTARKRGGGGRRGGKRGGRSGMYHILLLARHWVSIDPIVCVFYHCSSCFHHHHCDDQFHFLSLIVIDIIDIIDIGIVFLLLTIFILSIVESSRRVDQHR
jgi:hypothetical protein